MWYGKFGSVIEKNNIIKNILEINKIYGVIIIEGKVSLGLDKNDLLF